MSVDGPVSHPHAIPAAEVVDVLETDLDVGLTGAEARARSARLGPNSLPVAARAGPVRRLLRQMHDPLIYILLAAGVVTAALREYVDSAVIFGVVVVNALVGALQESRAEASLDALRAMVPARARVVRDGHERQADAADLVPGDVVRLEAGDKVPADLRVVEATAARADESALTGESVPVDKEDVVLPVPTVVADRRNVLHSGTLLTAGSVTGVVSRPAPRRNSARSSGW